MATINYKKGNCLNVFYHDATSWKVWAYSTNNSLSTSSETNQISSKDHGLHPDTEITGNSFSMSGEYLFTPENANVALGMQQSGLPYTFAFAQINQDNWQDGLKSVTDISTNTAWTPGSSFVKYGSALVTSVEVGASNGETATLSIELTGSGALSDSAPANASILKYPRS